MHSLIVRVIDIRAVLANVWGLVMHGVNDTGESDLQKVK